MVDQRYGLVQDPHIIENVYTGGLGTLVSSFTLSLLVKKNHVLLEFVYCLTSCFSKCAVLLCTGNNDSSFFWTVTWKPVSQNNSFLFINGLPRVF